MRTLSRYFVSRYLGLFGLILASAMLSITVVELLLNSDEILDPKAGPGQLLGWLFLRIPSYYLRDLIPISAFFAAFFTIGFAVRWLEWTALLAAGISPLRIVLPLLGTAAGLSLCIALANETLVVRLLQDHETTLRQNDEDLLFRAGAFWYQKGRMIFSIGGSDAATATLRGVEVFERTDGGRLLTHIRAPSVTVRPDGSWLIHDAVVRRFDPLHPERPTEMRVEPGFELAVGDSTTRLLEQTDAAMLPLPQLLEYLTVHARDDQPGSRAAMRRLRMLLHTRLSEPVVMLVFTLLALPLALRVRPGGSLAPPAVAAIGVMGTFYLVRNLSHGLAAREILPSPATLWAVLALFAGAGSLALWHAIRSRRH